MSEPSPKKYHLNFEASNEIEHHALRAKQVLERLAQNFASTDSDRSQDESDLVTQSDVRRAADLLFGSASSSEEAFAKDAPCVFLSYSTGDAEFVGELADDLTSAGISHFVANRSIRTASLWTEEIWKAVRACRVFVLVLTPRAKESEWCLAETGAAIGLNKIVVPLLRSVSPAEMPNPLQQFQATIVETREQQQRLIQFLKERCSS